MQIFSVLTILTCAALQSAALDYCAPALCTVGTTVSQHIDCNNAGRFGPQCPANAKSISIDGVKDLIVQMINVRRNRVATGNLAGFSTASRMPTVAWNTDLARLAMLNSKRCLVAHDACRNTYTFSRVGQIVATQFRSIGNINYRDHFITIIQNWFQKYSNANSAKMAAFTKAAPDYSHFALLVNERVTHVGCGSVSFKRNAQLHLITTCNFAARNVEGSPVYAVGTTASGCTTGSNPTYPGLCSTSEVVNPNAL